MGGGGNPQRKMVIASNPDDSNDPIVTSGNCLFHFDFAQRDHLKKLWNNLRLKCFYLIHLWAFHAGMRSRSVKHDAWWDNLSLLPGMQVLASALPSRSPSRASFSTSKHSSGPSPKTCVVCPNPGDRMHQLMKRWDSPSSTVTLQLHQMLNGQQQAGEFLATN